jgi:hypothetical protein
MALEEALAIQRETETISLTGWTFEQYDAQPAPRLARMWAYISIKNAVEKEKMDFDASASGPRPGGGGRRH